MINKPRVPSAYKLGSFALVALFLTPLVGSPTAIGRGPDAFSPPLPTQMPGQDRLAEPILPESPTQVDLGRHLYYFHCMPCHGDRGQGLTDEWREVWVEDHQNCWGRACHTGKSEVEAFYIPKYVPPVSGSAQALSAFPTADDLFVFLRKTQPPQRPGALSDSEYWDLTAFLLYENDRLTPNERIGPGAASQSVRNRDVILATLIPLLALFFVLWLGKRQTTIKSERIA